MAFFFLFFPSHFYDRCSKDYVELHSAAWNVPAGMLVIQTVEQQHNHKNKGRIRKKNENLI
jgi:hypothetical protein